MSSKRQMDSAWIAKDNQQMLADIFYVAPK